MKVLSKTILLALFASLLISLSQNFILWKEIRNKEACIHNETLALRSASEILAKQIVTKRQFSENTMTEMVYQFNSKHAELLKAEYKKEIREQISWKGKYALEKDRNEKLINFYFKPTPTSFFDNHIETKVSYQDSLHIGYTKNIFNDSKYELFINGKSEEYQKGKRYLIPSTNEIKIQVNKISIRENGMEIDTVSTYKIINKA